MFKNLTTVSLLILTCLSFTASAAPTWKSISPAVGGWVTAFEISPHDTNSVLVGGDVLGAAISGDKGYTWNNVYGFDMTEIESFEYHPTDPNIVFAATLGGAYNSIDGGVNWAAARNGWPARTYDRGMSAPVSSRVETVHPPGLSGKGQYFSSPGPVFLICTRINHKQHRRHILGCGRCRYTGHAESASGVHRG